MPNQGQGLKGFQKWRFRFRTMVRYRLLVLTSAPIAVTMLALVVITIYWSVHYTWQNTLNDVSERLSIASNSVEILKQKQANNVRAFTDSYRFHMQLNAYRDEKELALWVNQQKERYDLDFLSFHRINDMPSRYRYLDLSRQTSFFDVLDTQEMQEIDLLLSQRAQVPILEGGVEARALVSRTVVPVYNAQQAMIGFVDGGLILNNSTDLVDKIRDLIYSSETDNLRELGTITLFLYDLRVSTNVPLKNEESIGRAIGTRASSEVYQAVVDEHRTWIGRAYVYDDWYVTGYEPIRDQYGNAIGMLYTGYLLWPFIIMYFTNILEIAALIIVVLIASGYMVHRGVQALFTPIEKIHRVVKQVQLGKDQRIGRLNLDDEHELAQMAKQFDNMLDALQQRKQELTLAAQELEFKVNERTAKLKEKTNQLKTHIELLNQTRDKLVTHEKLAALGELTAGIAHEINNPVAVILGNVELMQLELGDDAGRVNEELTGIHEQIDRIRNITRSLLQYSRQGGVQDEVTWQHVNPIIDESITLVKTGSKKRDVEFSTELNSKTPVKVNRHHLLQVLVNLMVNGIHAMNGRGKLLIISEDWIENDELKGSVIHVKDRGCGISQENLKRIFAPFYTTKRDGTGLGLSVSQSMLSQIGGEMKVASEVGVGSVFSIYLPKKAEHYLSVTNIS